MSSRISRRYIPKAACLLLTPAAGTYGSTELDALDRLAAELAAVACTPARGEAAAQVIVDLSLISVGGSGLMGVLAQFRQQLHTTGRTLILCGDQTGLLRVVGWDRLLPLFESLYEALEHAGRANGEAPMAKSTLVA